jgi:hypothetical protein
MIRELNFEYTVYTLAKLARDKWGGNAVEYLAAAIDSVITEKQMKVLIDSLKEGDSD